FEPPLLVIERPGAAYELGVGHELALDGGVEALTEACRTHLADDHPCAARGRLIAPLDEHAVLRSRVRMIHFGVVPEWLIFRCERVRIRICDCFVVGTRAE